MPFHVDLRHVDEARGVGAEQVVTRAALGEHDGEPGRAREAGQPVQPLGIGGDVFALMLVAARAGLERGRRARCSAQLRLQLITERVPRDARVRVRHVNEDGEFGGIR